jgi:spermidine synthase
VPQSDSPTFYLHRVVDVVRKLAAIFQHTSLYLGQVTAYPGGVWAYTAASQGTPVAVSLDEARARKLEPHLRYANLAFIRAAFALPTYVQRGLAGAPPTALPGLADDPSGFGV